MQARSAVPGARLHFSIAFFENGSPAIDLRAVFFSADLMSGSDGLLFPVTLAR
jgi:hypothetical protein